MFVEISGMTGIRLRFHLAHKAWSPKIIYWPYYRYFASNPVEDWLRPPTKYADDVGSAFVACTPVLQEILGRQPASCASDIGAPFVFEPAVTPTVHPSTSEI